MHHFFSCKKGRLAEISRRRKPEITPSLIRKKGLAVAGKTPDYAYESPILNYTRPCAIIASATLMKPPMLAPFT